MSQDKKGWRVIDMILIIQRKDDQGYEAEFETPGSKNTRVIATITEHQNVLDIAAEAFQAGIQFAQEEETVNSDESKSADDLCTSDEELPEEQQEGTTTSPEDAKEWERLHNNSAIAATVRRFKRTYGPLFKTYK